MKITSDQLEKLKSLEEMAAKLRELQSQLDLLVEAIPKNSSWQGELRKLIAGFPASELLKITPEIQDLRDELSRTEFLHSHSGNCKARISSEHSQLEVKAKREFQEFLISIRQTITENLTDSNKIWAFSLTNSGSLQGATTADKISSLIANVSKIQERFPAGEVAS